MLSIGLMSGTSMDGIDAALLKTDGSLLIKDLGSSSIDYDPLFKILLKAAEFCVRNQLGDLNKAASHYQADLESYLGQELRLNEVEINSKMKELAAYLQETPQTLSLAKVIQHSTDLHRKAVEKLLSETAYTAQQIDVIGYHGQTLFHRPSLQCSIIVGDGQVLANQLGITVINDFRRNDLAKGGQGAPFAPLYHQALALRDNKLPLAVVNCGGIANITVINNSNILDLSAFDTGSGNGLVDRFIRQRSQGKENMDRNGQYGQQGKVHEPTLAALYEKSILQDGQNYFSLTPPKALDLGDMQLIPELNSLSLEDACRTLEAFTADSIVNSLSWINTEPPRQWILAGGGWNNPIIYHELKTRLEKKYGNKIKILKADEAGWNNQAVEAQIFAYFAVRSLQNKPLSVPGTTRISEPLSGGQGYLPETGATNKVVALIKANPQVLKGYRESSSL